MDGTRDPSGYTDEQIGRVLDAVLPTETARTVYREHPIVIDVCDKLDRLLETRAASTTGGYSTSHLRAALSADTSGDQP